MLNQRNTLMNYILVTGGAGFIGSNFVLDWIEKEKSTIINLDKLTYAGNMHNLESVAENPRHIFVRGDICDRSLVRDLLSKYQPKAIVHMAAETHVDRSIHGPEEFVEANIIGTFSLLQEGLSYWKTLSEGDRKNFRFLHISTDEVYGSLGKEDPPFSEDTKYAPSSPYSASKASSDHLVRSFHKTYDFPTLITNCSNNYGPMQFPEKLIPLMVLNAQKGKPLPVYGDGSNERNWLYVRDHCSALRCVLERGESGHTYNIGNERSVANHEIVRRICGTLDELIPNAPNGTHDSLITYVEDRPGHDWRYDINSSKIQNQLGWSPETPFEQGLKETVKWYLANPKWVEKVVSGEYRDWVAKQYQ